MNLIRRQTLLFLACAVVLLGAGFAWGYSNAYTRFYSPEATVDRELVRLDFDSRVLHYVNAGQRVQCRRDLVAQLRQQITFIRGMLNESSPEERSDSNRKLQEAERAIAGQPLNSDAPAPEKATAHR